jgi:hypothetical protein
MAYYIFLKSLRSLEEFRKISHVKIPPKSPSKNFQSHGKFKNPIFNSEILFPYFRPGRPSGPLGLGPAGPRWPPFSRRPKPTGRPDRSARVSIAYLRKYDFPFGSRLPCLPPLPRLSVKRAPAISSIPHLQPPMLARATTALRPPRAAQLRASVPPSRYHPAFISPP